MSGDRRRDALTDACRRGQLDVAQLWFRFIALGGDADPLELEAYLLGLMPLDDYQYDILAHALNERLAELGLARDVPYTGPCCSGRPPPAESGEQPAGPPEPAG